MNSQFVRGFCVFALAAILTATCGLLPAQDDRAEQAKEDALSRKLRTDFSNLTEIVLAGSFATPERKKELTDAYAIYFERFQLSVNQSKLPDIRKDMSKQLAIAAVAPNKEVHKEITAILQREMEKLANDPQMSIPVRHNAILMLGELDSAEGNRTVPIPAMLTLLLRFYDDPQGEDSLRMAALVGMQRHAAAGIADKAQVGEIQTRMLALLQNNQFLKKGSPEAQVFARKRALLVLRALRLPGVRNGDEVLLAAIAVLQDNAAPLSLKAYAAQTIGWLTLSASHAAHLETAGNAIGQFIVDVTSRPKAEYDQTRWMLYCAEVGLRGPDGERPAQPNQNDGTPASLLKLADGPRKQHLQELATRLDDILKTVDKSKPQLVNDPDPSRREKQAADNQLKWEADLLSACKPFREWLASAAAPPAKQP